MANAQQIKKNCLVLIPYWIANQVKRNGLSMDVVMDLDKLLKICSLEDVAAMAAINTTHSAQFVYSQLSDTNLGNITTVWSNQYPDQYRKTMMHLIAVNENGILARLKNATGKPSTITEFEYHHLAVKDNLAGGLGYVLPQGIWMGSDNEKLATILVKQYVKQSFGFSKFDQIAKDGVFKTYLKSIWLEELQAA